MLVLKWVGIGYVVCAIGVAALSAIGLVGLGVSAPDVRSAGVPLLVGGALFLGPLASFAFFTPSLVVAFLTLFAGAAVARVTRTILLGGMAWVLIAILLISVVGLTGLPSSVSRALELDPYGPYGWLVGVVIIVASPLLLVRGRRIAGEVRAWCLGNQPTPSPEA